ncbi:MAG: DinB family protein [Lunatimonas sp.]|uniref:DinB family protein n=1 Tax=Lunatimonas sp. TaxID=2060141 RepID=UPI00263BC834|nr:DinB family protein [Lunatimonas sp.]MCC5937037.1 DinB family protein [Lunatimonas sp.]
MKRKTKTFFIGMFFWVVSGAYAQSDPFLSEFLERWEGSKQYMLAIASEMPEELYGFRPTSEEMSFAEQLMHIAVTIEWHIFSRFDRQNTPYRVQEYRAEGLSKQEIINVLEKEMDKAAAHIAQFDPSRLIEHNQYGELRRTSRQFLLLAADHIAHHRGQLVVYLRMNGIKPPNYILYQ